MNEEETHTGFVYFTMAIMFVILLMLLSAGCQSVDYVEYDDLGQIKKEYHREGFINWSDGDNKVLPFGQISINGVGVGE